VGPTVTFSPAAHCGNARRRLLVDMQPAVVTLIAPIADRQDCVGKFAPPSVRRSLYDTVDAAILYVDHARVFRDTSRL
jgi:hypothetical protein